MSDKYGKIIKKYRKDSDLTQAELAKKLNITAQAVSAWESGRNEPNMGQVTQMAKIFGCKVSDLMGISNIEVSPDGKITGSDDLMEMLEKFKNADETTKEMVRRILQ